MLGLVEMLSAKSPLKFFHLELFLVFLEFLKFLELLLFSKLLQLLLLLKLLLKLLLLLKESLLLSLVETGGLGMGVHPRRWGITLLQLL